MKTFAPIIFEKGINSFWKNNRIIITLQPGLKRYTNGYHVHKNNAPACFKKEKEGIENKEMDVEELVEVI